MKCRLDELHSVEIESLPSLGAWIEVHLPYAMQILSESLPSLGAWIEVVLYRLPSIIFSSLPSLGAWIEVNVDHVLDWINEVAPFIGSVD